MSKENKIASSPSIQGLEKCLNEYFYSSTFKICPQTLEVTNAKGTVNSVVIKKAKGRFLACN